MWENNLAITRKPMSCHPPGVGVTKPISPIPLFSQIFTIAKTLVTCWTSCSYLTGVAAAWVWWHIEGILPKGPYLPCVSMAGRSLLAGYPQYVKYESNSKNLSVSAARSNISLTEKSTNEALVTPTPDLSSIFHLIAGMWYACYSMPQGICSHHNGIGMLVKIRSRSN